jgi:arginyl-tRNA synthetase
MNLFNLFLDQVKALIEGEFAAGRIPAGLDLARVAVETPREAAHGHLSTNAAMVLAQAAKMKPRDLAAIIAEGIGKFAHVTKVEIAGPGFINWWVADSFWRTRLVDVLREGTAYGDSELGRGARVNVEYVSANPTGPLHAAHARGAVVGDALASLLQKAGYAVTREYYINDAGAQVNVFARSLHLRYREALGQTIGEIPSGLYPGDYVKDVARDLVARDGAKWLDKEESAWLEPLRAFGVAAVMQWIKTDLERLGIKHDVFSSERALVEAGAVEAAAAVLEEKGLLYIGVLEPPKGKTPDDWEPRPQTLFKATAYGDDVDRPLKKSDGSWTYFAADIAYHWDKARRSADQLIDVLGADHGGYVKRMQAAVKAITDGKAELDVKICQLVSLLDNGKPVKMSKRAGTFVTLSDVLDAVGKDVIRFIMLTRRNDQTLEFDYAKVTEQSKDNPVFYVQYAHARCASVLRHAATAHASWDLSGTGLAVVNLGRLDHEAELALIRLLVSWPRAVEQAAVAHEAHRIAFFLQEVAAAFHALWNQGKDHAALRFLIDGDDEITRARLAMVLAVKTVIASGLQVLGVTPVEEMHA